jgi:hypothetical protein
MAHPENRENTIENKILNHKRIPKRIKKDTIVKYLTVFLRI